MWQQKENDMDELHCLDCKNLHRIERTKAGYAEIREKMVYDYTCLLTKKSITQYDLTFVTCSHYEIKGE